MKTFLLLLLKVFLILLLVFLLLASIPVPALILPTIALYCPVVFLWTRSKKVKNANRGVYSQAYGILLATYGVNYLCGLPEKNKVISCISMFLTEQGFLFQGHDFEFYISHDRVMRFELIKGTGFAQGFNPIWDIIKAKLFEITYLDDNNLQICVRFEMYVSSFYIGKNYIACEELMRVMKNNSVFDKFITSSQVSQPIDITTQIEKLSSLHESGVLTDDEFQIKKSELLKRL